MDNVLGIDLGTNSIGMTLREGDFFKWYGVYTFKKGVGVKEGKEYSLAGERTKHRSSRRLYNARRYRKWETLKVLIENDYCPLKLEELNNWKHYKKGVGRVFPLYNEQFNNWIKLDFDNDGKVDYTSPYQLRRKLITTKFDLNNQENRYKIGRALYHIAQRRGFKSSRKIGKTEKNAINEGSPKTGTIGRDTYKDLIHEHGTLGAAFAYLEDEGVRVRNRYTLRSDYRAEVERILEFQNVDNKEFSDEVIKAIFYQNPLRSQKGLVGKCTMEPKKPRCPLSHPNFEEYRAWSFVNNIKYKQKGDKEFKPLPIALKQRLIEEKLMLKKVKTEFKQIRNFICKNERKNWELNYSKRMDKISIPTMSICAHLKDAFGENWKDLKIEKNRVNIKGESYAVTYNIYDIWHILFSFEDEEYFDEFLINTLKLNDHQVNVLKKLWDSFPVGYANLSLKAINNILPFLKQGLIYSQAVFLAKIPEVIGKDVFDDNREGIIESLQSIINAINYRKMIVNITNSIISEYKGEDWEGRHARLDYNYVINEYDKKDVLKGIIKFFGQNKWADFEKDYKDAIINNVEIEYQAFFNDRKRDYRKQPKLIDAIQEFLVEKFDLNEADLSKIYHPSMIDIYPSKENQRFLESPRTRAFKNPMAYKTLHKLRFIINHLIEKGLIDDETRIVVEIARELNDKNKRAAIERYQRNREKENNKISEKILELINEGEIKTIQSPTSTDIRKYRLWEEQKGLCFYSGKVIKITDLFNDNIVDFEHTIPRSKSFDNSLANLTVCYADYNRDVKGNKIPTELPNYDRESLGYQPIKPKLDDWINKIKSLEERIDKLVFKSKIAIDKNAKDEAIKSRHILKMELDYWKNKVDRFTRVDVPSGFKNSQLIDTQIISKYAYHYLKTIFNQVDVIKGSTTSTFRKIYNINSDKSRDDHSHHAVDAAVLTLIPTRAKLKQTLLNKYTYEESYRNKKYHEKPFEGFNYKMIDDLKKDILINNIKEQDRTLDKAKRFVRKRGKIVYLRNNHGEFLRDETGNKIPKIATGDSVRGQLHQETFYGKIKVAKTDENENLLRDEQGNILYEHEKGKEVFKMVGRKKIEDINFKTDDILDKRLAEHLKKQLDEGVGQKELKDFQGNVVRRLRCGMKLNPENVETIKEQTYKSNKDYKNYYYAKRGGSYMFGLYEDDKGNRDIISINIFETTKLTLDQNNESKENIFKSLEPVFIRKGKKRELGNLIHIFEENQKVLFFFNHKEELKDLDKDDLSSRLYRVKNLYDSFNGRILFEKHLEARDNKKLKKEYGSPGEKGFSIGRISENFMPPRILFAPKKDVLIFEGRDFEMNLSGEIIFKF